MITQAELKELLNYDQDTGIFTWKVSNCSRVKIGQVAGGNNGQGYIQININRKLYKAHRLAWLYVYGEWPTKEIDHIDQTRNHNWIKNLREVTRSQNKQNMGKPITNTSGFKGVFFNKKTNNWRSQITIKGKKTNLGCFKTPELASEAYKYAQEKYHSHRPQI